MYVENMIDHAIKVGAWKEIKYISPTEIIRVTRKLLGGKIPKRGNKEFYVTIGKPNYQERVYVKECKKAGEPFPVKKIWWRFPPKKRAR